MVNGSIRLFRLFGITVYLHWSWFAIAALFIWLGKRYESSAWYALEYGTLFLIVLMHEFGHSLACRSVGGSADTIILWPLGGIAFVNPPMRPGAFLWSIFAGPLVNILLVPVTFVGLWIVLNQYPNPLADDQYQAMSDGMRYLFNLFEINSLLLIFNLIPVYPLDGGQIFQSILWFFLGYIRSLRLASIVGIAGAGLLMFYAIQGGGSWLAVMSLFLGSQALNGYRRAQQLAANAPGFPVVTRR